MRAITIWSSRTYSEGASFILSLSTISSSFSSSRHLKIALILYGFSLMRSNRLWFYRFILYFFNSFAKYFAWVAGLPPFSSVCWFAKNMRRLAAYNFVKFGTSRLLMFSGLRIWSPFVRRPSLLLVMIMSVSCSHFYQSSLRA